MSDQRSEASDSEHTRLGLVEVLLVERQLPDATRIAERQDTQLFGVVHD